MIFVHAQVGLVPVRSAHAGVAREPVERRLAFLGCRARTFEQHRVIDSVDPLLDFGQERPQLGRPRVERLVVPRGRGIRGHEVGVARVGVQTRRAGEEIHVRRNQDDAVQRHVVPRQQIVAHAAGADAAVAFAEDELRAAPSAGSRRGSAR